MLSIHTSAHLFRRVPQAAQQGLYAGKQVKFGNRVSEKWESKSRRMWKPNVQRAKLYSAILDETIQIKVTTALLRTVDKKGGLDNYLLGTKNKNIGSEFGLQLKARLKDALAQQGQTVSAVRATWASQKLTKPAPETQPSAPKSAESNENPFLIDLLLPTESKTQ
ncbi:hypothetical protein H4R34_003273 [Dimargaris verticillata]|uniref:Large ribosomal subunit protein bL28m n=1 Tax=Dimargaris verticillata TaxID=2761393 RepID=A0A9W8EC60_9FUNG|nr:hypothetical protein H4R34_003273 [Dimargaris verticillata]